jgi:hypothetical protein
MRDRPRSTTSVTATRIMVSAAPAKASPGPSCEDADGERDPARRIDHHRGPELAHGKGELRLKAAIR